MNAWSVDAGSDAHAAALFARHPGVDAVTTSGASDFAFTNGTWARRIVRCNPHTEVGGLIELMDNNPLVCADVASTPSDGATLALLALEPLIRAGLLLERPAIVANFAPSANDVDGFLAKANWTGGALWATDPLELGTVRTATAMAVVPMLDRLHEIDDLYDEAYGRSLYVRRDESSVWQPGLVEGKPYALYRLRITTGPSEALLTIQTMADAHGKCGAAQAVHMFNVMCGFEESLGID